MRIGEIADRSGASRDTIRYYEKLGLVTVESRDSENNYKRYGSLTLERLLQIQRLKDVGFTLNEIRQLLCADNGETNRCANLPDKLTLKIEKIDAQIATLKNFKMSLLDIQRSCNENCDAVKGMPTCMPTAAEAKRSSNCC